MNVKVVVPALPSATLTSLIDSVGAASSLVIVPRPLPSLMVALVGAERSTVKVSLASKTASRQTVTTTFWVVVAARKFRAPEFDDVVDARGARDACDGGPGVVVTATDEPSVVAPVFVTMNVNVVDPAPCLRWPLRR